MAGITIESPTSVADPIISQGGVSITIRAENVDEEYTNPVFTITPPTSTPNQGAGPKSTWIINLLRIDAKFVIRGYVDAADRANLRTMFQTGNQKDNPCVLTWDGLTAVDGSSLKGIIEKLILHRPGTEEQEEWPVDITFVRGSVR